MPGPGLPLGYRGGKVGEPLPLLAFRDHAMP